MFPRRGLRVLGALALAVGLAGGCAAFRVPEEPPRPTPVDPIISEEELRDHIEFLNVEDLTGRATGTLGYARAAAYVAARMREFRLQPAVDDDFRIVYGASINYLVTSALRLIGEADSLSFVAGIDFLPDARSDSGTVRLSRLMIGDAPPEGATRSPFVVVLRGDVRHDLEAWRDAGARLALMIDDLRPRLHSAPVPGLLVAQVTERAAGRLLGVPAVRLPAYLDVQRGKMIGLPRQIFARITTEYRPRAGAINMMGYFSGKNPVRRGEVVIVCADLDAVGQTAGIPALDFRNFGISTAAVLEVVRNLGYVTRRWSVPERSVMIAIWSGSQLGHEGLRYFLEHPTWQLEKVRSLIYVGLAAGEEPAVRRLLSPYGIPLTVIPPGDEPLSAYEVLLLPDPVARRMAQDRDRDLPHLENPDMSTLFDSAAVRARALAARAYDAMLLRSTDADSFLPADADTLPEPPAAAGVE